MSEPNDDGEKYSDGAQRLKERTADTATITKVGSAGTTPPSEMSTSDLKREYDALFPAMGDKADRLLAIGEELENRGVDLEAIA